MAKYLVLIYGDEQRWTDASEQWLASNSEGHAAFTAAAGAAITGGHELAPSSTATCLRTNVEGRRIVTDGPFLETKEGLGGYYLLEAPDLDEAIRLASMVPEASSPFSGVEIRAVQEHG